MKNNTKQAKTSKNKQSKPKQNKDPEGILQTRTRRAVQTAKTSKTQAKTSQNKARILRESSRPGPGEPYGQPKQAKTSKKQAKTSKNKPKQDEDPEGIFQTRLRRAPRVAKIKKHREQPMKSNQKQ